MDIAIEPDKLPPQVPLSVFEKSSIGSAENNGETFDIYIGLDADQATQLREYSLNTADAALQQNTSDFLRFGQEGYEAWHSKGRVPFALVHRETGALAAFVWFGPKALGKKSMRHLSEIERAEANPPADEWHTIAFRSYPPFRGTGIMRKFVDAATDVYMHYYPGAKLWTSNSRDNLSSVALSEKLGYKTDESLSDAEVVTMIRT